MAMDEWDRGEDGQPHVAPFLGWEAAASTLTGFVRLRYAATAEQYESGGIALQLAMTPVQLRQLSLGLLKMAELIEARAPNLQ